MPRKPLGTYTRDTASQFQHQRARATCSVKLVSTTTLALGIFNNDSSGRVCHILGVNVVGIGVLTPVWAECYCQGDYFSGSLPALDVSDEVFDQTIEPFFDLDPVPAIEPVVGISAASGFPPSFTVIIPLAPVVASFPLVPARQYTYATASHYPPGGLAAFKPGRGFALYLGDQANMVWTAMFDFVLLPD